MFYPSKRASQARPGAAAVIMFALLLGSVGAAAWMVHARQAPARHAADLLQQLRKDTLAKYWPQKEQTLWYLTRNSSGQPIGWLCSTRGPTPGGFTGKELKGQIRETWHLQSDLSGGEYICNDGTTITLSGGQVTVRRFTDEGEIPATSSAPENYVPEGTLPLMVRLVNSRRQPAAFRMLFNDAAIVAGQVHFLPATLTPEAPGRVRYEHRYELDGRMHQLKRVFHLDEAGEIVRIDDLMQVDNLSAQWSHALSSLEELKSFFPDDDELRKQYRPGRTTRRTAPVFLPGGDV